MIKRYAPYIFLATSLFIVVATVAFYFVAVGIEGQLSSATEHWGQFGDYFGGVAGTLLGFISLILLLGTLYLQHLQLEEMRDENVKRDMLLHISKADDEIENLLCGKLHYGNLSELVDFRQVVIGAITANINAKELAVMQDRLLQLTCHYSASIALYEENINTHFVYRHYREKALSLVKYLENNITNLSGMGGPALLICRQHLDGA
jgi:hypothetical protein